MKFKKIVAIVIASFMVLEVNSISVNAESVDNSVFDSDTVDKLWEQIDNTTDIVQDKYTLDKKNSTTSNTTLNSSLNSTSSTTSASTLTSTGTYPTRKGVILVTKDAYKNLIPTGHSAIVLSSSTVCESVSDGVIIGSNNWATTKDSCYGVTVNGTTTAQDSEAADWCVNQVGKPYNYNYYNMNTREKFYCSQLVWAAFKDLYGIDLNTDNYDITLFGQHATAIHPEELILTDNTSTIYEK